ncbi:Acid phosphatase 1 [Cardamine amara subsp. amara]|uniref:Acid phosphatase 1 n=1 Tax=Cardamine amara subsp. amara TaxID=228776 RepID=A0ABD1B4I3_CARAN
MKVKGVLPRKISRTPVISVGNRLLLRGHEDQGKAAAQYKSEQRSKVVKEGFKIHGNTGDQRSDLQGFAVAARSFKVPNPLHY